MSIEESRMWVFSGEGAALPSAVFGDRALAEAWIAKHQLSGLLTAYPLNQSVYEWAIEKGFFQTTTAAHFRPDWIQRFSSAYLEHYHYESGRRIGASDNSALAGPDIPPPPVTT